MTMTADAVAVRRVLIHCEVDCARTLTASRYALVRFALFSSFGPWSSFLLDLWFSTVDDNA